MPVFLMPILWAAGGVVVLGGGCNMITHIIH